MKQYLAVASSKSPILEPAVSACSSFSCFQLSLPPAKQLECQLLAEKVSIEAQSLASTSAIQYRTYHLGKEPDEGAYVYLRCPLAKLQSVYARMLLSRMCISFRLQTQPPCKLMVSDQITGCSALLVHKMHAAATHRNPGKPDSCRCTSRFEVQGRGLPSQREVCQAGEVERSASVPWTLCSPFSKSGHELCERLLITTASLLA